MPRRSEQLVGEFIKIDATNHAAALRLAQQTLAIFARMPGHYNNTLNSHLRGKLGEIAAESWLASNAVKTDAAFRDTSRIKDADIVASSSQDLRLDVKTWDRAYWPEMGRCVAVGQLDRLRAKADGIVWCVSPSVLDPGTEVELVGWNTLADIAGAPRRMTGPKGKRLVDNYQVDGDKVRPLLSLLAALAAEQ